MKGLFGKIEAMNDEARYSVWTALEKEGKLCRGVTCFGLVLRLGMRRFAKGGKPRCGLPPFVFRFAPFCMVKCGLLHKR